MSNTIVETVSGKFLDLADPKPEAIDIDDIAWSLSRLARYNGHTIQEIPYTVGQHSVFVAQRIMSLYPEMPLLGLMGLLHDAGEAYTGDLTGPLKNIPELRPVIKNIEQKIDDAIYQKFNISERMFSGGLKEAEKIVKEADIYCLAIEAYNFMSSRGKHWELPVKPSFVEYQQFEMPKSNIEVYEEFMEMFNNLVNLHNNFIIDIGEGL